MAKKTTTQDCIDAFTELITKISDPESIHDVMLELYFDYSQAVTRTEADYREGCHNQLFHLSLLIKALKGES